MILEIVIPVGLVGLIIYMIKYPEKVEKWGVIFSKIFSRFHQGSERRSVSSEIQSQITSYRNNYAVPDVLPYGLKFKWVHKGNFESYVQEGEVIILMDVHQNNARNFLNAIKAYTSTGLIPNSKNFIPREVFVATELLVQRKMILEERPDALEIFNTEIAPSKIRSLSGVKKYVEKLQLIQDEGLFDSVFLSELSHAGPRIQEFGENVGKQEIEKVIELLEYLSKRKTGDESGPLTYEGKVFQIWVILIAKYEKITHQGVKPYLNRAKEAISNKYDSIYLLTRGEKIKFLNPIIDSIKENTSATLIWKKVFKTKYTKKTKSKILVGLFRV